MSRLIKSLIILIVILKLAALPLGSYPFDFAAFVYQARSYFEYGLSPLFYLNKGLSIVLLFYVPYSIYTILLMPFGGGENVLLLHTLFKLPLMLLDLGTGILIWKILDSYASSQKIKTFGLLLWLANPFVFWMTEFQGQYAVSVVFFMTLSLYYILVREKFGRALISLAIASSIYYFPIVFLPFIILWQSRHGLKLKPIIYSAIKASSTFALSMAVLYLPFLLNPSYLGGLFSSLLHHSAPDAPQNHSEIVVPLYSLFRFPYYLLSGTWPSNLASPAYFHMVSLLTFIGIGVIGLYVAYRTVRLLQKQTYSTRSFVVDLITVLTIFIVTIGKLQSHYILWLLPLLIVAICALHIEKLLLFFGFISTLPIIVILGGTNLSIFLIDVLPWGSVPVYLNYSPYTQALGGFTIVFLMVAGLLYVLKSREQLVPPKIKKSFFWVWTVFFGAMLAVVIFSYAQMLREGVRPGLASEKLVYSYSFKPKTSKSSIVATDQTNLPMPDNSFEGKYTAGPRSSGYLTETASPWYFYNFGKYSAIKASITGTEAYTGKQSAKIEATGVGARGQLAIAKERAMLSVDATHVYSVGAVLKLANVDKNAASLKVRFAYGDHDIIPGSDIVIARASGTRGWQEYRRDITVPRNAKFMQVLISLDKLQQGNKAALLLVDDVSVYQKDALRSFDYAKVLPVGNKKAIYSNIVNSEETNKKFEFRVKVGPVPIFGGAIKAKLNDCQSRFYPIKNTDDTRQYYYEARFASHCIHTSSDNHLAIETKNLPYIEPSMKLSHISKSYDIPFNRMIILAVLFTSGSFVLVAATARIVRNYLVMVRKPGRKDA